jgi:hypothetical protein
MYAVGADVQLELELPGVGSETAQCTVLAYDVATDRLVVRQPGSTPFHSTLRVLKGAHVTRIVQLKPAPGTPEPLPQVDLGRCREREEKAVRAAEAEAAKIGVGVGRQAQVRHNAGKHCAFSQCCLQKQSTLLGLSHRLLAAGSRLAVVAGCL